MLAQAGGADARKGGSVFRARLSITFLAAGAHSLFEVRSCSYSASLDDDHDSGGRVVDFRPSFEGKRRSGDLRRVLPQRVRRGSGGRVSALVADEVTHRGEA